MGEVTALHKARLKPGETVAVFGAGGLGMSAVQLDADAINETMDALEQFSGEVRTVIVP